MEMRWSLLSVLAVLALASVPGQAFVTDTTAIATGEVDQQGSACGPSANVTLRATVAWTQLREPYDHRNGFDLTVRDDCGGSTWAAGSYDGDHPCQRADDGTVRCHNVFGSSDNSTISSGESTPTDVAVELGPEGGFEANVTSDDREEPLVLTGTLERLDI